MPTNEGYADRALQEALRSASYGVDFDLAGETVHDLMQAAAKMARALKEAEYSTERQKRVVCPACRHAFGVAMPAIEALAKAVSQVVKGLDETARLTAFADGKPDSRPGVTIDGGALAGLSDTQLAQVQEWLRAAERGDG